MLYVLISILIFTVDFLIKQNMEESRKLGEEEKILGGKILLRKFYNTGAMFGFLKERQKLVAGVSAGISAGAVIAYFYLLGKQGMNLLKLGAAFIIGGAASNVYDRLVRKYVIDYFSFNVKIEKIKRIIFNISDLFIFVGSFLIVLGDFRRKS